MAKASLSGAGDVSLQSEAGGRIHRLGQSIYQLSNGTKVLAVSIAEVDESKTGEGERVCLPPYAFVVVDSEWVGASHPGAI